MSNKTITIDENQNCIIPESLKRIPQYNHRVQTYTIDCPRYTQNGEDMLNMIPFVSVEKEGTKEPITEACTLPKKKEDDENRIVFDWTITRDATDTKGKLAFVVCIKKTVDESIENAWHTHRNEEIKVEKGIACLDILMKSYPAIIDGILVRLGLLEKNGVSGSVSAAAVSYDDTKTELGADNVQDAVGKVLETMDDLKASEVTGISAGLTGVLRTYFTNVQTILPQIAYVTEDNIGKTLIQNAKDVVAVLGGEIVEPDEPIEPDNPEVPTVTKYTITNNLTNVTTDNPITSINENSGYTANLTPSEEYEFDSVVVTMNGVDITDIAYSDGVITIESVTGNVVITASAKEVEQESDEVVLLKNIAFDGTSYLDTEIIPETVNYRYVLGIQAPNKDIVSNKNIGGISMRNSTSPSESSYWDMYWRCTLENNSYNDDVPSFRFYYNCMGMDSNPYTGKDKGDGASSQPYNTPLYYNLDNGTQSVWHNEDCTENVVKGHFPDTPKAIDFTSQSNYTDEEHPIDSIWLGKVHVTGIMNNLATEANTYAGVKFYCFKVYDENENLIADMKPAKQGSTIGMYCNVRQKFFVGNGTLTYEELEVA